MSDRSIYLHNAKCELEDLESSINYLELSEKDSAIIGTGLSIISGVLTKITPEIEEEAEEEEMELVDDLNLAVNPPPGPYLDKELSKVRVVKTRKSTTRQDSHEAFLERKAKEKEYEC